MKKSVVLKKEIDAKRIEVENFQREEKIPEAKKAAAELSRMVDEYDVTVAMERSDFENHLANAKPLNQFSGDDEKTLRNRAFNKLLFKRGQLTDEERRAYFNVSNEEGQPGTPGLIGSVNTRGGYLVPQEQIATLREFRKAYTQLKNYCHVVTANSTTGTWPTLGEESGLLVNFKELAAINESSFEFGQADYEILDYGDIIPVSNQLIADANVDIMSIVGQRLARKAVNTENSVVVAKLNELATNAPTITDFKGLNKALIKTLDPIYLANASIFTNQDGFLWLSNLTDENKRPLLLPDVTAPDTYRYKGKPVVVVPNSILANTTSGSASTTPIFIGNLADYLMFFERQGVEIAVSTEYLFAKYGTALRCVVRFGVTVDDSSAMVALNVATPT